MIWSPPVADDRYVAESAWERAVLDECPFHPRGQCGLERLGSYPRVHPAGTRIARFWCPLERASISLLPTFLAARVPSTLDEIESVIEAVETASIAAAAETMRPAEAEDAVTSVSAARWVRRRLRSVRAALIAIVTLVPELAGCTPTLGAIRVRLGITRVLVCLRVLAAPHLSGLAPPLGLGARGRR